MYGEQRQLLFCVATQLFFFFSFFFLASQHMTFWQCSKFSFTIVLQIVLFYSFCYTSLVSACDRECKGLFLEHIVLADPFRVI